MQLLNKLPRVKPSYGIFNNTAHSKQLHVDGAEKQQNQVYYTTVRGNTTRKWTEKVKNGNS